MAERGRRAPQAWAGLGRAFRARPDGNGDSADPSSERERRAARGFTLLLFLAAAAAVLRVMTWESGPL